MFVFLIGVAGEVFNRCSTPNDTKDGQINPDSKLYNVTFNYEFLEDFRDVKENACSRFFRRLSERWKNMLLQLNILIFFQAH